jgi:hypothetical protein
METSYPGAPKRQGTPAAVLGMLIFLIVWQIILLAVVSATLHEVHEVKGRIPARTTG